MSFYGFIKQNSFLFSAISSDSGKIGVYSDKIITQ